MRFIMLRCRCGPEAVDAIPTWVNIKNINTIRTALDGGASRITLRDGILYCEEDVSAVMEKIRRAEDDR